MRGMCVVCIYLSHLTAANARGCLEVQRDQNTSRRDLEYCKETYILGKETYLCTGAYLTDANARGCLEVAKESTLRCP